MIEESVTSTVNVSTKGWPEFLFAGWLAKRRALGAFKAAVDIDMRKLDKIEKEYCPHVWKLLSRSGLSGLPYGNVQMVKLPQVYVHLNIQQLSKREDKEGSKYDEIGTEHRMQGTLTMEQVVKQTFSSKQDQEVLLIDGDAGSGKTTLAAHLFEFCLHKNAAKEMGFNKPVIPIYLPLREFDPDLSLFKNLENWIQSKNLKLTADNFERWLNNGKKYIILILDGLDEISDFEKRQKTCDIIKDLPPNCYTVLTTRRSALVREEEGNKEHLALDFFYHHARISDFNDKQKREFLVNWFTALELNKPTEEKKTKKWMTKKRVAGSKTAEKLLKYINEELNENLNKLAGIPMILQIMAMVWDMESKVPDNQAELYKAALDYLLQYRDMRRRMPVPLSAKNGHKVLRPLCLWIQTKLDKEEVPQTEFEPMMNFYLKKLRKNVNAKEYCTYLVERAWLLALNDNRYIFRHKSFREYFAGVELAAKYFSKLEGKVSLIDVLVDNFNLSWWENPTRFFFQETDSEGFKAFIFTFFTSNRSKALSQADRTYMIELMQSSTECDVSVFDNLFEKELLNPYQQIYALECLKALNSAESYNAIQNLNRKKLTNEARGYIHDLLAEKGIAGTEKELIVKLNKQGLQTFRNPLEYNAEYILIPGGEFTTGEEKVKWKAKNRFFAKYPVTNKQYRRFVRYLAEQEDELQAKLPVSKFMPILTEFIGQTDGFAEYLKAQEGSAYHEKFTSEHDTKRDFNSDDQPVVGVSWYDAKAYCLWLSAFEQLEKMGTLENLPFIFDLPHEYDWEWAAAGREPDGSLREYPWPKEKGEPNEKLANYDRKVGKTTPVGRYPEGATPEGLHDMAGNVWEWQENTLSETNNNRALRGGAWINLPQVLRCAFRYDYVPSLRLNDIGFRCARTC